MCRSIGREKWSSEVDFAFDAQGKNTKFIIGSVMGANQCFKHLNRHSYVRECWICNTKMTVMSFKI